MDHAGTMDSDVAGQHYSAHRVWKEPDGQLCHYDPVRHHCTGLSGYCLSINGAGVGYSAGSYIPSLLGSIPSRPTSSKLDEEKE